jgi:hypothetical protein
MVPENLITIEYTRVSNKVITINGMAQVFMASRTRTVESRDHEMEERRKKG